MDENPDGGSIFWFDLPRWSSEQDRGPDGEESRYAFLQANAACCRNAKKLNAKPRKAASASLMNRPSQPKGLVLVAEDNPDLRRYISRLLEASWGKDVRHGRQALEFLQKTARMC